MKRSPIKKIGERGKANITARKMIADICEEKGLNYCEMRLEGCLGNFALAPAHKHKRSHYQGDPERLADFNEWVVACQVCHDKQENDRELTEELFKKLRNG